MHQDVDRLLEERKLGGFVALGSPRHSASLRYFLGDASLGDAWYLRGRGGKAHLIHNPMERDDAARVGVELSTPAQNEYRKLLEAADSPAHATARMVGNRLRQMGISGRLGIYGVGDAGMAMQLGHTLEKEYGFSLEPDGKATLPEEARATKDASEIETTRRLGKITCEVMGRVRETLASLRPADGRLVRPDGGAAKLGDLRRIVRLGFAAEGLWEPHGSIISQGRDAGVPHNRGNDAEEIRPGEPIIVDIFPQEQASGYHFDMTRTFCVGAPKPGLDEVFETVREAHVRALESFRLGAPAREYQEAVCDLFEARGHRTIRQDDKAVEGYVHSLGHGVGLDLHERPRLASSSGSLDVLVPGSLFTVEPGLYYPSRGIAVRLEDIVVAREDGVFENLTPFPLDMVVGGVPSPGRG